VASIAVGFCGFNQYRLLFFHGIWHYSDTSIAVQAIPKGILYCFSIEHFPEIV
jgi:hypothetical protein